MSLYSLYKIYSLNTTRGFDTIVSKGEQFYLGIWVALLLPLHTFLLVVLKLLELMWHEQRGCEDTACGVLCVLLLSLPFQ